MIARGNFALLLLVVAGCVPHPPPEADAPQSPPAPGVHLSIAAQQTRGTRAGFTLRIDNGDDAELPLGHDAIRLYDDHNRELRRLDTNTLTLPPHSHASIEAEFDAPQAEGREYRILFQESDSLPIRIAPHHQKPWYFCFPEFVIDVTRSICSAFVCGH